jgi:hypothetical protein
MLGFLNTILLVGGMMAAVAVGVMCGVCLFVWLAGGRFATRK